MEESILIDNEIIEKAIVKLNAEQNQDNFFAVLESIRVQMNAEGRFMVPVEIPQAATDMIDLENVKVGDVVQAKEDLHFVMRKLQLENAEEALVAFTSQEEVNKGQPTSILSHSMDTFLKGVVCMAGIAGVVLNPWGASFLLGKDMIEMIFQVNEKPKVESHIHFELGDITQLDCDCIVNASNKSLLGKDGVSGEIHRAAGPELMMECRSLHGCHPGEAKITKGYNLKASSIIHTVGPIYSGKEEDEQILESCYWNSLTIAKEHHIHSIAFPAISTGACRYPLEEAIPVAMLTVTKWLDANKDYVMEVIFSCFDQRTYDMFQEFVQQCNPQDDTL